MPDTAFMYDYLDTRTQPAWMKCKLGISDTENIKGRYILTKQRNPVLLNFLCPVIQTCGNRFTNINSALF